MTKIEALKQFRSEILPDIVRHFGNDDKPAKSQAWNDWTDMLCKCGQITQHQYNTWGNPF